MSPPSDGALSVAEIRNYNSLAKKRVLVWFVQQNGGENVLLGPYSVFPSVLFVVLNISAGDL